MATRFRIGHGFDLHRLEPLAPAGAGRPFILGGIRIPHSLGPVGHSDGDAVLHAITDALLGATAAPDIGQLFPDTDPANDGTDSAVFLEAARARLAEGGWVIGNVDITVVCENPKIGPHKEAMRANIAGLLGCDVGQVNVKGKTNEGVDAIGAGEAVAVHVVALIDRSEEPR